MEGRTDI
jgi:hypothetical protein